MSTSKNDEDKRYRDKIIRRTVIPTEKITLSAKITTSKNEKQL